MEPTNQEVGNRNSFDILSNQEIKVIIVGDSCTGKTTLLEAFTKKTLHFPWTVSLNLCYSKKVILLSNLLLHI